MIVCGRGAQGPNLRKILRQTYDNLTIMTELKIIIRKSYDILGHGFSTILRTWLTTILRHILRSFVNLARDSQLVTVNGRMLFLDISADSGWYSLSVLCFDTVCTGHEWVTGLCLLGVASCSVWSKCYLLTRACLLSMSMKRTSQRLEKIQFVTMNGFAWLKVAQVHKFFLLPNQTLFIMPFRSLSTVFIGRCSGFWHSK